MGHELIEGLDTTTVSMVNVMTNIQAAGCVYLLQTKSDVLKSAHMLVIIDMLGCSDEKNITGLMVHIKANIDEHYYQNTTTLEVKPWSFPREQLYITYIGNLTDSEYLSNPNFIPAYVIQYQTSAIFGQIANINIPVGIRCALIHLLANNVYYRFISNNDNQQLLTSSLNGQEFVKDFLTDGLGLRWPDIKVTGDQFI